MFISVMNKADSLILSEKLFDKHLSLYPTMAHYPGIVTMHSLARIAVLSGDERLLKKAKDQLAPFVSGERGDFPCNFPNYRCGGIGTAFLLFSGLALGEDAYVEDAFQQTAKMVARFKNQETGLLHQCLNFKGPGELTEDHWSRGNGWGAYALTEFATYLPGGDSRRKEAQKMFREHIDACANFQDPKGLWHQEMTMPGSYVETSGTGLMLYALESRKFNGNKAFL